MSCKSFPSPDGLTASVPNAGLYVRRTAAGPFGSRGSLCGSNGGALRPATCCWMILSFHEVYRCSPRGDYHGEIPAQAASLACLRRLRISITPNRSTGSEPSSSTFSNLTRTNPPQPAVAYSGQVASAVGGGSPPVSGSDSTLSENGVRTDWQRTPLLSDAPGARGNKRRPDMKRRHEGFSLPQLIEELRPYLSGWRGY